jgi:HlyD family secretion protein
MDVVKPVAEQRARRRRRVVVVGIGVMLAVAAVYAAAGMERGVPIVDKTGLWIDTVQRGALTREIRAVGTLVSDDDASLWLAAELEGRVDRKLLNEGATVQPDTVILQLSNPDVEQAAVAADLALQAAEAAYASLDASLHNELLALRSAAAAIESDRAQAVMQAEVDAALAKDGLLAVVTSKQSTVKSDALGTRLKLEQDRVRTSEESLQTRLAVQRAEVDNRRTVAQLKHRDLASLTVRAGMPGVLQDIVAEVGQRVARSANLARVVDPARLKAELRIPEAQTADLREGLQVTIDTRNGIVPGVITRIAPAAQNGTVTVDARIAGALPSGARPDMTVDGIIQLEQIGDVLHVGRPAAAERQGVVTLYRVSADGTHAERVSIKVGRTSASAIELIGDTLRAGDRVVLSDTSAWGDHAQVRFRP